MTDKETLRTNTVERLNTRIDMIREESRTLSHRIAILEERRKELQENKRHFKNLLLEIQGKVDT
jgi:predicted  nucleic acid-binding Zn-ribbon protein